MKVASSVTVVLAVVLFALGSYTHGLYSGCAAGCPGPDYAMRCLGTAMTITGVIGFFVALTWCVSSWKWQR